MLLDDMAQRSRVLKEAVVALGFNEHQSSRRFGDLKPKEAVSFLDGWKA